jgi:hypothetical protein
MDKRDFIGKATLSRFFGQPLSGYNAGMKPSFNFLDLLPFQFLGGLGIVCAVLGYVAGGLWLFIGLAVAAVLWFAAVRSAPMR